MCIKQTKIVATISDIRCEIDFIKDLYEAGINVVRLNTAHMEMEKAKILIKNVRSVSKHIGILIDTKGPEIRTRDIKEPVKFEEGDEILIGHNIGDKSGFDVNYDGFVAEVKVGAFILIDDGETKFKVLDKKNGVLVCRAENSGVVKNKKSVNVPGAKFDLPSVSAKDLDFIKFAIDQDLEFIAHSFVRNTADVHEVQKILDEANSDIKIIAKIENREGVENINSITDEVYGIMVARGDLGIEIPQEEVPIVQKKIIETCRRKGKPVITATQMLHTMIENPRPTRAEVSDIANAVYDGTDAIMLSGETAYGDYPVEAVKTMDSICKSIEPQRNVNTGKTDIQYDNKILEHICYSAARATREMPIKAIIADTLTGRAPRFLSAYRGQTPIYVVTKSPRVMRELALSYGVFSTCDNDAKSTNELMATGFKYFTKKELLKEDDMVVIVAGSSKGVKFANFFEICTADTWHPIIEK